MHRNVPRAAFDFLRHVHDFAHVDFLVVQFFQIGIFFERAFKRHWKSLRSHGDQFGNSIADAQTAIYAKRRTLCDTIKGTLETQLVEEEKFAKSVIRASIKKILDATSRKALQLRMSEDYDISLVNADGTALAKSSGENQLLGLSFTAALVEFAKNRERAEDYKLLPGTIAPLVLDSPFGQLDPDYRQTTAEYIPEMAHQVVLLLSKSQGSPEVLEELSDRIGAEFLLVRHNRETPGARKPETRVLKGKEYRTAVFDSQFDGTEVVEV